MLTRVVGRIYDGLCEGLWLAAAFLLPITSFPPLAERLGGIVVAPLSAFLFLLLAAVWLLQRLLRGGKIPVESWPLLAFVAAALVSFACALFADVPYFRGFDPLREGIQAFATLALGLASFVVPAAWLMSDSPRLRRTLQVVSLGGIVLLIWCFVQAWYVIFLDSEFPQRLIAFQWLFSSRQGGPLLVGRATGFAYEPSFLAHQLNLVYLPLWLAFTLRGTTVFPRLWRISVENVLLVGGVFTLFISFSRVGWLSFLVVLILLASALGWKVAQFIVRRLLPQAQTRWLQVGLSALILLAVTVAYAWGTWQLLQVGARYEPRLERILSRNIFMAQNIYEFFNNLEFAERAVYWAAGMRTFSRHWLVGVGPGNLGFYFSQDVPRFGWWLTEITDLLYRFSFLPNAKNFWVRLLAETGLIGFAVFVSWFVMLLRAGWLCWRSQDHMIQTVGLMGLFALSAFLVEGFSIDSFALPYLWFAAGLLVAARSIATASRVGVEASAG
jgi:hypothetical protein